jgi:HNH endonuclease
MKIENPSLLKQMRSVNRCEQCRNYWKPFELHHIMARGMDDAFRMDIQENLILLCRYCHAKVHTEGEDFRRELLKTVAAREGFERWDLLLLHLRSLRYARTIEGSLPTDADDKRDGIHPKTIPDQAGSCMEAEEEDGWVCFS